jgi:hypothetical protein
VSALFAFEPMNKGTAASETAFDRVTGHSKVRLIKTARATLCGSPRVEGAELKVCVRLAQFSQISR